MSNFSLITFFILSMLFCHLQIAEFQLRNLIGALSHFPYIWGIFLLLLLKFFPWFLLMLSSPCHACSVVSDSLWLHELQPTRLLCPWDFPDKNTRVDYHFLLQGIFPTRGLNLSLLNCRHVHYCLSQQRSPFVSCCKNKYLEEEGKGLKGCGGPGDGRVTKM